MLPGSIATVYEQKGMNRNFQQQGHLLRDSAKNEVNSEIVDEYERILVDKGSIN
jgi:hypothetical protein